MNKKELKIKFSRESRINDHDVDCYTLYYNNKLIYNTRYKSCVISYINENFASKKLTRLNKKFSKLCKEYMSLTNKLDKIQKAINTPLVKVIEE